MGHGHTDLGAVVEAAFREEAMISVIIPAHNEERVLKRCLEGVTAGADPSQLELVVVCNGCTDRSAAIARSFPFPVRVVETEVASKTNAWNLGDKTASCFPRFYLDADVKISWEAILKVAHALEEPAVLAAAPRIEIDTAMASFPVRAFYRIWLQLPYFRSNMIGSGVFALNQAGRSRFGCFPDVIADDNFVRCRFHAYERRTVTECTFTIFAPRDVASLVRIKTRSRLGRMQLERAGIAAAETESSQVRSLLELARNPTNWASLFVYAWITLWTRVRAHRRAAAGAFEIWERDDSSRQDVGAGS
jgi:glycosyltransferase involved in cell wall biosynthesis